MTRHHSANRQKENELRPHSSWGRSQNRARLRPEQLLFLVDSAVGLEQQCVGKRLAPCWLRWPFLHPVPSSHIFFTSCMHFPSSWMYLSGATHYYIWLLLGYRCWDFTIHSGMLLRLQADCNSSDLLPGLPSSRLMGGPSRGEAVLTDWSAFVLLSKERQALAKGLGRGVDIILFVPAAVSCEERRTDKALLSA